jgi:hypothetical protein
MVHRLWQCSNPSWSQHDHVGHGRRLHSIRHQQTCPVSVATWWDEHSPSLPWSDGPKLLYISPDHVSAQNSAIRDPSRVLLWQLWWTLKSSNIWSSSEGGKWSTVNTASRSAPIYHEIVYCLQKSAILTVCLVQTRDWEVPFISTLEFMPLPDVLYPHLDPNISFFD